MMKQNITLNILEGYRGFISSKNYLEVASVNAALHYLSEKEEYEDLVSISRILKAEDRAHEEFQMMLIEIVEKIPYFKGVFTALTFLRELEATQVTQLFYHLNTLMENYSVKEWFPQTFEVLMKNMGKDLTEYHTPETVNELAVSILNPAQGSFYDGAAGYGGTLREVHRYNESLTIYGQEVNAKAWAIAKIRLFIEGDHSAEIMQGDALSKPAFTKETSLEKFDYAFMSAPFSMKIDQYETVKNDDYRQFFYGIPSSSNADYAFISHVLASLKSDGHAVAVVTEGALFRGGAEGRVRGNILAADLVEAVVSLPSGLFHQTSIPVSLLVFNKNKEASRKNKILFVKANELVSEENRQRYLAEGTIQKIVEVIQQGIEESGFSRFVKVNDLMDSNLNVSRYVLPTDAEIEGFGKVHFNMKALEKVEKVQLKDVAEFFRGYNISSKNVESASGEFRIVKLSDVQEGQLLLDDVARYDIENNARVDMYKLQENDVILSIRGATLKTAVISIDDESLLLSQNFIGIRCGNQLNPDFLKVFLESPLGQYTLSNKMSGTAVPTLKRSDIETLEIPRIPIEEQNEMMSAYTEKENQVAEEIARLKAGLMDMKIDTYQKMGIKETFEM